MAYPYYMIKRGIKEVYEGRYFNTSGVAVAVVAVVTPGIDWAAYIGGTTATRHEDEAIVYAAEWGAKLSEEDARYFFPAIKLPYRP